MAHAAPPPPSRRRNLRLAGAALLVVGIALLVVAIVSLARPKQKADSAATVTPSNTSAVTSTSASVTTSARPSPSASPSSVARSTPPATPTRTTAPAVVTKVPLIVANNTGQAGLAATAANRFEAAGWQVSDLQNFDGGILSTCAYYDPSSPVNLAAAQELQREFPAIKRVRPRFDGLPAAPIVVVLTTDYS